MDLVRLACVRHAASVRPEPGSNSPSRSWSPSRGSVTFDRRAGIGLAALCRLAQFWLPPVRREVVRKVHIELKGRPSTGLPARGRPHSPFWHPLFRCQGSLGLPQGTQPERGAEAARGSGTSVTKRCTGASGQAICTRRRSQLGAERRASPSRVCAQPTTRRT